MTAHSGIDAAEATLRVAMLASDVAALDRLIDDRLLFVGPDGKLYSKADDLERHRSGFQKITKLDVVERRIEEHEGCAVVSVVADMEVRVGSEQHAGRFRYLRVWKKSGDAWRIVGGSVGVAG